jgi:hypothetical protein
MGRWLLGRLFCNSGIQDDLHRAVEVANTAMGSAGLVLPV